MPEKDDLDNMTDLFSAFSDQTRLKILSALSICELCVGDLSDVLEIHQTTISHQLKFLKDLNLIKSRRVGKIIFYALSGDLVGNIMNVGVASIAKE